jgi:hypothetical protein
MKLSAVVLAVLAPLAVLALAAPEPEAMAEAVAAPVPEALPEAMAEPMPEPLPEAEAEAEAEPLAATPTKYGKPKPTPKPTPKPKPRVCLKRCYPVDKYVKCPAKYVSRPTSSQSIKRTSKEICVMYSPSRDGCRRRSLQGKRGRMGEGKWPLANQDRSGAMRCCDNSRPTAAKE